MAAGLLLSPIAWHNYSMLLWPGVLVVLAAGRRGMAATMLALAVIPVSWNEVLPPDRAGRKVVSAGHERFSGCCRRPRMVSRRCGSLRIFRMVAAMRV